MASTVVDQPLSWCLSSLFGGLNVTGVLQPFVYWPNGFQNYPLWALSSNTEAHLLREGFEKQLGGHDTRYNRTLWSTYRFSRTCIWRFLALESAVKSCEVQQSFLSRCLRQSTEFRKSPECQILCLLGDIGNPLDEDRQFKAQQYRSFLYEQAKVRY